jgi:hypothetical protein
MKKLGAVARGPKPAQLTKPGPLRSRWQRQVCRVDCLLAQFPGGTEALWSYLGATGTYLDRARQALSYLETEPANRQGGPPLKKLAARYNAMARASNHAHGLELYARRPPPRAVALDDSSFRKKVQRWRKDVASDLAAFAKQWTPLVRSDKPNGPALERPIRLRVALARLIHELRVHTGAARALTCARGKRCAARQKTWSQAQKVLGQLLAACKTITTRLRAETKLGLATGRKLAAQLDAPLQASRKAVDKLLW